MTATVTGGPPTSAVPVLTAVTGESEAALVAGLDAPGSGVRVVRRCADLTELLAAADAGLARASVLSADLHRLDGDALARLAAVGAAVVALVEPGDPRGREQAERLTALGVQHVVAADLPPSRIAEIIVAAAADNRARTVALPANPCPAVVPGRLLDPGAEADAGPAVVAAPVSSPGPTRDGGAGQDPGRTADPAASAAPAVPAAPPAPAVPAPPRRGVLVAVWGPVGSPGRTTVAVTLASEIAALGATAMLADADTYGPSVAQVLGLLDESAGLGAAVRAALQGGLDPERLARLAPFIGPNLRVLTGLPRPSRWPELRPSGLEVVWHHARGVADWTVVDCGFALEADEEITFDTTAPRRNGATLSALSAADVVLAVGTADPVGLQRLVRGLQELADVLPPGRVPRVVVTRVRPGGVGSYPNLRVADALARYAGVTSVVLVPDDRPAFDAALLAGRTVTEVVPGSSARQALAALAAELVLGPAAAGRSRRRLGRLTGGSPVRSAADGRSRSVRSSAAADSP